MVAFHQGSDWRCNCAVADEDAELQGLRAHLQLQLWKTSSTEQTDYKM